MSGLSRAASWSALARLELDGRRFSVALSDDGNTTIVGGPFDNSYVGAAWVFTRSGGARTQQGNKLVGTGAGNARQGVSVALSADGNTAIVGGPGNNTDTGAAWVFTRSGRCPGTSRATSWSAPARLETPDRAFFLRRVVRRRQHRNYGRACRQRGHRGGVDLHPQRRCLDPAGQQAGRHRREGKRQTRPLGRSLRHGHTASVGGPADNANAGAAWAYNHSGGFWTQQGGKLVGTGAVGSATQGASVTLSGDGNTAVVGGPFDNSDIGAAWVYTRSGGVWGQQGNKLVGSDVLEGAIQGH